MGRRCVAQIGYFGRPFETKKLREIQGDEKDYLRFVLGQKPNLMIPAMEEGLASMAEGGVRQLIVPPSIGYPKSDMAHETVGVRGRRLEPAVPCSHPLVLTCVPRPPPSPLSYPLTAQADNLLRAACPQLCAREPGAPQHDDVAR